MTNGEIKRFLEKSLELPKVPDRDSVAMIWELANLRGSIRLLIALLDAEPNKPDYDGTCYEEE
jgi:hypothetical protein